jgi:hypothetical protein
MAEMSRPRSARRPAQGIAAFAYRGINYRTQHDVVDLGPIHVTAERSHTVTLPPIVGAIALIGAAVLFAVAGARKS